MSSSSKRQLSSSRAIKGLPSAKRIKYTSVTFAGARHKLAARDAAVTPHQGGSSQPQVHFNRSGEAPNPADAWQAHDEPGLNSLVDESESTEQDFDADEDLEDVVLSPSMSRGGKGQNQMLAEWLNVYATSYLRHMYSQYNPPNPNLLCSCGGSSPPVFLCRDCIGGSYTCRSCTVSDHRLLPTHRIRKWAQTHLKPVTLRDLGHHLVLGNHRDGCPTGSVRTILLGDVNGIHKIDVVFCHCPGLSATTPSDYQQLLVARIFPCSDERPSSAFTFNVLQMFHLAATDGKMSGGRFYALLSRLTSSTLPESVPDRYREFMCVAHQWMLLQTKKRAGCLDAKDTRQVAIRCPACPQLGVNYEPGDVTRDNRYLYTTHICYDGSFQLVQCQRAEDDHDVCLTGDSLFFVDTALYEKYLADRQDDGLQNTRIGDCNNHKAAAGAWTVFEGLAVTGVGACSCARHAFYMPRGVVNYYKGERFAYTDYAIGSIINQLKAEGCQNLGLYYDIFCHWSQKWWDRAATLPSPVTPPECFIGGIPKYHLAGHTDSCYVRYSLNNMAGVGRLDAEGCERLWADANQASKSTSNKGSGAWIDSINHLFQDWNWRKTTTVASLLLRKMKQAREMSVEKRAQWEEFNNCIQPALQEKWSRLDTKPSRDNQGRWTSVYITAEKPTMSVTQTLQKLRGIESSSSTLPNNAREVFNFADWLAEGFAIELLQEKLRHDIKAYGKVPTPSQALDIGRRRQSLQQRLTRHSQDAALFFSSEQLALYVLPSGSLDESLVLGKPETAKLVLPSRLERLCKHAAIQKDPAFLEQERILRRACCLQVLSRLCTTSQQKALLVGHKSKHVRGEVKNTRLQTMITRLTDCVQLAAWEYRNSRSALLALGASQNDQSRLKPLLDADISGLTSMLQEDRSTGEGHRQLPWFWAIRSMTVGEFDESSNEADAALMVEWFRGKARYERWEEEVKILEREMASVLFSFNAEIQRWTNRATTLEASFNQGYQSFCQQQASMWRIMHADAVLKFRIVQEHISHNDTCRRAVDQFLQ
ncbi:hypothetical protein FRC08_000418 [Ceratobasidium sp. 394]|nr:hypothetical protein FRC08_000418 [Ceratobasidium sp. 394]